MERRGLNGYIPITYDDLASMTGIPVAEIDEYAADLDRCGLFEVIRSGGLLYYRVRIGGGALAGRN
ncbi:hypothetical protein [Paenibacillus tengchongensis]|uniref:hypothetical protein n=1 Tax=Paenibacillus tengchongensis TaxID=2608684 RepID=UPI00124DF769|nr:hypothetical protein [Paenibacillus tengchongensis]